MTIKIKFLVIAILGFVLLLSAQYNFDFTCLDDTVKIATDTTTFVTFYFRLQNTGTLPDSYAFDCRIVDSVPGWDEIFCVGGLCAPPGVILYDYLLAGEIDTNIDVGVYPGPNYGIEVLNLHVSSVGNPDLKDSINVIVKKELAIEETRKPDTERIRLEAFPNPFLRNLTIKFQVPNPNDFTPFDSKHQTGQANPKSQISLNIYDTSGRLVKNFSLATCYCSVVWDGTDSSGNIMGAGAYICCLETQNRVWIKKLIILK